MVPLLMASTDYSPVTAGLAGLTLYGHAAPFKRHSFDDLLPDLLEVWNRYGHHDLVMYEHPEHRIEFPRQPKNSFFDNVRGGALAHERRRLSEGARRITTHPPAPSVIQHLACAALFPDTLAPLAKYRVLILHFLKEGPNHNRIKTIIDHVIDTKAIIPAVPDRLNVLPARGVSEDLDSHLCMRVSAILE